MGATAMAQPETTNAAAPVELDAATLGLARAGDAEACRALVERYERPVFALISRMLGSGGAGEVEDLAQETFLRVFRALPRFDPSGPARLSTWILTIATRRCIDARRRTGAAVESLDAHRGILESGERPDAEVARRELGRRVATAMAALPSDHRAAFVLRAFHDLDYAEIAEALECDIGTVKSRISRARARLRGALEHRSEGAGHGRA
jgi:RNA polymerase sigma-70 factor (ECF subfamily)